MEKVQIPDIKVHIQVFHGRQETKTKNVKEMTKYT